MKITPKVLQEKIKQNLELFYVLLLILISIFITQIFELSKNQSSKEYIKLINNIYFKKTIKNIFGNFQPKFLSIEHKIRDSETINTILRSYNIPSNDELNK